MKAKDLLSDNRPPSILLYGCAGSGKTALASQIGAEGYLFDFDRGMRTALTLNDSFSSLRQSTEFDEFIDDNVNSPTAYLQAKNKLLQLSSGKNPYKAICIDSLTGLCRSIQLHVMSCSGNSLAVPQIQHWGMIVNEIESMLTIIRSFKILTIITAHELFIETETGNMLRPMSATTKHSTNKLTWLFDEVLYMKPRLRAQNKVDYVVTARPMTNASVRSRSGLTEDVVINEIGLSGLLEKLKYVWHGKAV